ncbi:MAG TPA: hypothetical protein VFV28_03360 [Limnobacter sp.]|nr:hypothetical protein [Limnobacter sp.]
MSRPFTPLALVRQSRLLRPLLDALLAVAALAASVHLYAGFQPIQIKQPVTRPVPVVPGKKTQPLFLDSRHGSEEELWKAWAAWITDHKPETGHCQFETQQDTGQNLFHLQCFGSVSEHPARQEVPDEVLIEKRLFSVDDRRSRSKARTGSQRIETPREEPKPAYPVRGWIDTDAGRKHYNPGTGKWQDNP